MTKKKLKRFFNLKIKSKSAAFENQNIGPNLSPYMQKDKINNFCSNFNEKTIIFNSCEIELFVKFFLYIDGSFRFLIKGPKISFLLKLFYNLIKIDVILLDFKINLKIFLKIIYFKNFFFNKKLNNYNKKLIISQHIKSLFFSIKNLNKCL